MTIIVNSLLTVPVKDFLKIGQCSMQPWNKKLGGIFFDRLCTKIFSRNLYARSRWKQLLRKNNDSGKLPPLVLLLLVSGEKLSLLQSWEHCTPGKETVHSPRMTTASASNTVNSFVNVRASLAAWAKFVHDLKLHSFLRPQTIQQWQSSGWPLSNTVKFPHISPTLCGSHNHVIQIPVSCILSNSMTLKYNSNDSIITQRNATKIHHQKLIFLMMYLLMNKLFTVNTMTGATVPTLVFPDKIFSLTIPRSMINSLTAVQFPDISTFSRTVVTLHSWVTCVVCYAVTQSISHGRQRRQIAYITINVADRRMHGPWRAGPRNPLSKTGQ